MAAQTQTAGGKAPAAGASAPGASTEAERAVPADLLKKAGAVPQGLVGKVEEFDPMESIPTLRVGGDFAKDMVIGGYFESTEELASVKFTKSQTRNEAGVPTSFRHVLRIGSPTGDRLAIWSTGELKMVFSKLLPGDFIQLTYKGKGKNAANNDQHFFEYKVSRGASTPALN